MRFLFTTLPTNDLGLLARALPIAHALRSRGHEVVFSSPARAPRLVVADAGFENVAPRHPLYDLLALGNAASVARYLRERRWRRYGSLLTVAREVFGAIPLRRAPATAEVWNMDHAGACMGLMDEGFVRAGVESLRRLIVELRPEVVVDFWNPLAVIAARSLGTPVATVIQADAHPDSRGFLWWRTPPADLPTPVPVINRVLADLSCAPVRTVADLSVGDLTLVMGTPETDPLPERARVTYIGALVWQKAAAALPATVVALPEDKPVVWVYSGNPRYGSTGGALDSFVILEASIAALADLDVSVVLTTGHHALPDELGRLPPRFIHERYVPAFAMAERCEVLVHHGGYASCQTGLESGRPAVIMPTYAERESNARRMAAIGAAIVVPVAERAGKKRVDAAALRASVSRVLADPGYAQNARRAGDRLRAQGGADRAAELIGRLAADGSEPSARRPPAAPTPNRGPA